ncbi:MAG TPA: hypothetical protein VLE19_08705 [Pyrinomonadaceae bacterium]|nr:hypothetical protein [Pyrinomonadaceae bacterium]
MNVAQLKHLLVALALILLLVPVNQAQSPVTQTSASGVLQTTNSSLPLIPEADTVVYFSPQKILNEVAPKVIQPSELAQMRAMFVDWKRSIGIDPASIEYVALAFRFNKPAADLNFVAPDVLAVASGDFSADSLIALVGLYLQDNARTEQYASKTITIMKIDPIAAEAAKNPLLKSFAELGVVALNTNTIAFGNLNYLKAAVDAAAGNGRISSATVGSLLRDPNALISVAGSPLLAFAKSFGMLGTQTVARENRCESKFGDFYAAVTMEGTNFSLRGAMNADNPDTAKIINGLLAGVLQQAIDYVPEKETQSVLKNLKVVPKENEITFEVDVPQATLASLIRNNATTPKKVSPPTTKPATRPKRRTRRP